MTKFVPINYLTVEYAFLVYALNERVMNQKSRCELQMDSLRVYFLIFSDDLVKSLSASRVEKWLSNLFDYLFERSLSSSLATLSNQIFERIIKKCVKRLLAEPSLKPINTFIDTVFFIFFNLKCLV